MLMDPTVLSLRFLQVQKEAELEGSPANPGIETGIFHTLPWQALLEQKEVLSTPPGFSVVTV
jgi:hypothetical protein